jgi:hypothetical protein
LALLHRPSLCDNLAIRSSLRSSHSRHSTGDCVKPLASVPFLWLPGITQHRTFLSSLISHPHKHRVPLGRPNIRTSGQPRIFTTHTTKYTSGKRSWFSFLAVLPILAGDVAGVLVQPFAPTRRTLDSTRASCLLLDRQTALGCCVRRRGASSPESNPPSIHHRRAET